MPPRLPLIVLGYCGAFAALFLLAASLLFAHTSWHVTPNHLEFVTRYLGLHWTRRIPRSKVAALRIGYQIGDKGHLRHVIEYVRPDGKRKQLGCDSIPNLRFIATHLRRALGVPATSPELDRLDPKHPDYHLQDQDVPPKNTRITIQQRQDCTIISKSPDGLRPNTFAIVVSLALLAAAVLLPILAFPNAANDEDQRIIIGIAVGATILGTLLAVLAAFAAYDRYLLMITPSEFVYLHKYLIGRTEKCFPRPQITSVTSICTTKLSPHRLVITLTTGKQVEVLSTEKPELPRYLATQLRKSLALQGPAIRQANHL